jgi:hypothetical protein
MKPLRVGFADFIQGHISRGMNITLPILEK